MKGLSVACFFLTAIACGDYRLDPLPFQVGIEASKLTTVTGDTINFVVSAQGGSLLQVLVTYGDGTEDLFPTAGARTARITFKHAFETAGSFDVEATVIDAAAGSKSAAMQVTIN